MEGPGLLWFLLIASIILSLAYSLGGHFLLRPIIQAALVGLGIFLFVSFIARFW